MPDIVLTTLNARYAHASLGLRYLAANLGELRPNAIIAEYTIQDRASDIVENILAHNPKIVGIGVYIWNAKLSLEVVSVLKKIKPGLTIVLGGPEVSHEYQQQEIVALADFTLPGEADLRFAALCRRVLSENVDDAERVLLAPPPEISQLAMPYEEYTDKDIAERTIYVEVSRGCPFSCEFCLSSLDVAVRNFDLEAFLGEMDKLIARGARQFKFVDRTFNLNVRIASSILDFFLARMRNNLFIHFEMVPDRFPETLRDLVKQFPEGSLQFEVGIQTFSPEVSARISRRQNYQKVEDNLRFLRSDTRVHVHSDLIVGLPGESLESFASGFDRLVSLDPQEIQVGILKRLRGTPISRHTDEWALTFASEPPYEILCNGLLPFDVMQRLKRFARAWDLVANSGNFRSSMVLLWGEGSPFHAFLAFSDWLYQQVGPFKGIALDRLTRLLLEYCVKHRGLATSSVAPLLASDYVRPGRRMPSFLADLTPEPLPATPRGLPSTPRRQARHL